MQIGTKGIVIALVLGVGVAIGAYMLGTRQHQPQFDLQADSTSETGQVAALPENSQPTAMRLPPGATLPPGHRPITDAGEQLPASAASSNNKIAHFRVGNRNVKAILADGKTMWVGTSGGVVRYDTEKDDHKLYDVRSGLLSNGVFHISMLGNKLMVGTYGGGLSLFDKEKESWENFNIQHGLGDAFVYDALKLANGDIWIATWSGANRVRGGELNDRSKWDLYTVENTSGGLPNDWVYGLAEGKNGEVWMATEGGLARFHDEKWTSWSHKEGLGADYDIVKDAIKFNRDPAKESSHHARQKVEQGLGNVDIAYNPNYIVSLAVDEDGTVWAGTWGGGLGHYDGKSWTNLTTHDGLPSNHVFMLKNDPKGKLWIGTSEGLARYDGKNFKVYTTRDGLFANNIFSMATGDQGDLWIGSFGGVTRMKGL
jgi:ligand-binding sensor domain-containing protein